MSAAHELVKLGEGESGESGSEGSGGEGELGGGGKKVGVGWKP